MTLTFGDGPTVGRLGFGAMRITGRGVWGPPPDEGEAMTLLRRVADKGVTFYWSEVQGIKTYHLSISRNQFFTPSSVVFDRNITDSHVVLKDMAVGTYFWHVRSIGENGKESVESPRSRFTLVPKGADGTSIALELSDFVQHGHSIEVKGRTEAGARVMVNGQEAVVNSDGTFRHFTNPLPTGENMITVTAQNAKGGVSTKQQSVVIQ